MYIRKNSNFCDSFNYVEGVTRLVEEVTKGLIGADFIYVLTKIKLEYYLPAITKSEKVRSVLVRLKWTSLGLLLLEK